MKKLVFFSILTIVLLQQLVILPGCANMIPPSGGPRDTIPPTLLFVNPADSSTNFNAKRIVFEFDEYLDVQNAFSQLIVSPVPNVMPNVTAKLRTLTVTLRDSLEPNTTYSINFGDAVKDYNEGNPLRNFTYVFSTGAQIDTFTLEGNVLLARSGALDTTLIVMLHRSGEDSAVAKERPRYFTKLDREGNFRFRFLPADSFYLYAVQDQGGSRRYTSPTQLFAFAADPVMIGENNAPITLYAYAEEEAAATGSSSRTTTQQPQPIRYTTNIATAPLDITGNIQLRFDQPLQSWDSTQISITTDSIFTPFRPQRFSLDTSRKLLTIEGNWLPGTSYQMLLAPGFAVDTAGRQLTATDTLEFTSRKLTDYGSVAMRFRNLETYTNPVLQFVLNNQVVASFPLQGESFNRPLFLPGDYEIRILNDENGNGIWNPGKFFGVRRQPEIVRPVTSRKVNIKADWQNEFEIEAPVN